MSNQLSVVSEHFSTSQVMSISLVEYHENARDIKLELCNCLKNGGGEIHADYVECIWQYCCISCTEVDRVSVRSRREPLFLACVLLQHFYFCDGGGLPCHSDLPLIVSIAAIDNPEMAQAALSFVNEIVQQCMMKKDYSCTNLVIARAVLHAVVYRHVRAIDMFDKVCLSYQQVDVEVGYTSKLIMVLKRSCEIRSIPVCNQIVDAMVAQLMN